MADPAIPSVVTGFQKTSTDAWMMTRLTIFVIA
eukprot:CAMPEP_0194294070 /NCGR_PEP_ID=MMETSP0169-20130528/49576_1 /TAXON_ID=218684 /ORGANISM="Corethron pennatum, Strain L29A3" /LENGTH=32 /DNA_ID= /DNA_START= /DNA_END= /DNA_ORIENTATION=